VEPPHKLKDRARYGLLDDDFDVLLEGLRNPRRFSLTPRQLARAAASAPLYFSLKLAGMVAVGVLAWAALTVAISFVT
jgi:hypothetical protein